MAKNKTTPSTPGGTGRQQGPAVRGSDSVAARIDAEEFQEAQRDPRVRAFLREAKAYGARLKQEGRNR